MTDNPASLYQAWLDVVPKALRMLAPFGIDGMASATDGADGKAAASSAALPFPADQVGQAVDMLGALLTRLYQAYLPLLGNGSGLSAQAVQTMADGWSRGFEQLLAAWDASAAAAANLAEGRTATLMSQASWMPPELKALVPGAGGSDAAARQLRLGLERTFGGLSDAFGLGALREVEQAYGEMLAAGAAKQRAQIEYLMLVAQAWNAGTRDLLKDLQAMAARGERVESLLDFIRRWVRAVDAPMHDAMQSARGLEVTARMIRAATRYREQLRNTVGLASDALFMPTRAEMDEAYREIQALKRELRSLRRLLPKAAKETDR